jgi:perosamine synthetase
MTTTNLAINGGSSAVVSAKPHRIWPPAAGLRELRLLAKQRNSALNSKTIDGPVSELEKNFLHFLNNSTGYAMAFNSYASGLLAACVGVGIGAGDEVIVSALSSYATIAPLLALKAVPVGVDIDSANWCIDPQKIKQAITEKTKALLVTHQWGRSAEMKQIVAIAHQHDLKLIEECSLAQGSTYHGQSVGSFGEVAVFSLDVHQLIFAGEGAMVLVNDIEVYDRMVRFENYGMHLRLSPLGAVVALSANPTKKPP